MSTQNPDLSSLRIDNSKRSPAAHRGRNSRRLFSVGIPALLIIAGVAAAIIAAGNSAVKVKAATVALQSPAAYDAVLTASGYVIAETEAAVTSKATGILVYLGVGAGDKVTKGEIIARLEDNDVKAQLAEAKANLELNNAAFADAKWNYERDKKLLKTESITESAYETAEAQYMKAKASVDVAKANVQATQVAVENTIIRAPFNGTVLTKNANVGEIVAPMAGSIMARGTVATIADLSSLEVEPDVSESNIGQVSPGQPCIITLDAYPDVQYRGYVSKIIPTADRAKGTVTVKVKFTKYDSRVLPEMSAKVLFLAANKSLGDKPAARVLVVPSSAVVTRDGNQVAFRIVNGRALETRVSVGQSFSSYVQVKSGLSDDEQVVDSPSRQIKDGTKVSVKE